MRRPGSLAKAVVLTLLALPALAACGGGESDGGSSSTSSATSTSVVADTADTATSSNLASDESADKAPAPADAPADSPADAYVSPSGDFTVDFPEAPREDTQTRPVMGIDVENFIFGLTVDDDRFAVVRSDMAAVVEASGQTIESQLDAVIGGFVGAANGETTSNETITFEGYPARRYEFEATGPDGSFTGDGLVIATDDLLYQIAAYGPDAASHSSFVDSFHLTETAAD